MDRSTCAFKPVSVCGGWERAKKLGSTEPGHYVFPRCENGQFDAKQPQKSWLTAFRKITSLAGLKGLRFHDLRHHAITELAEAGETEKKALDSLESKPKRKKAAKEVQRSENLHVTNVATEDLRAPCSRSEPGSG